MFYSGEMLVIVEYCKYGDLQSYVTKSRNRFVNQVDSMGTLNSLNSPSTQSTQSDLNYFVIGCVSPSIVDEEYENGQSAEAGVSERMQYKKEAHTISDSSSVSSEDVAREAQVTIHDHGKLDCQVIEMMPELITTAVSYQDKIDIDLNNYQECPDWSMKYETDHKMTDEEVLPVSTRDLIGWSFQIARGMDFLASKKVSSLRGKSNPIYILNSYD